MQFIQFSDVFTSGKIRAFWRHLRIIKMAIKASTNETDSEDVKMHETVGKELHFVCISWSRWVFLCFLLKKGANCNHKDLSFRYILKQVLLSAEIEWVWVTVDRGGLCCACAEISLHARARYPFCPPSKGTFNLSCSNAIEVRSAH